MQQMLLVPLAFAPAGPHLSLAQNSVGCCARLVLQYRPGGDLEGGLDDRRNADISALKRLFYTAGAASKDEEDDVAAPADGTVAETRDTNYQLGIYLDIPLARWSMNLLPHQQASCSSPHLALRPAPEPGASHRRFVSQVLLNVFQPEYVHMFETLLATSEPWLYLHVKLPGGVANLGSPDWALPGVPGVEASPNGSRAPLDGTLMRVVAVQRQPDARLALVVQGLGRAHVLRGTQALPYARADVQLLPDSEALCAAARATRRFRRRGGANGSLGGELSDAAWRRLVMVAAVAEERHWWAYEAKPVKIGRRLPPAFCSFDPAEAGASARAAAAVQDALSSAPAPPAHNGGVEGVEEYELDAGRGPLRAALQAAVEVARAEDDAAEDDVAAAAAEATATAAVGVGADEVEEAERLLALEVQVWAEFDALLRRIAASTDTPSQVPAPAQLLSLLPPPPSAGWPAGFILEKIVVGLRRRASEQRANQWYNEADETEPYVPCTASYPHRRRAQRLSYSIWSAIRDDQTDHQSVLEMPSTSDRLRAVLLRLRDVSARLDAE